MSWADIEARRGTSASLLRAESLAPVNSQYHYLRALLLQQTDPKSPEIEKELSVAVSLNPRYTDAILEWSLVREFKGDIAGAERLLLQAEKIDHQLRPAWALANFYFRRGTMNRQLWTQSYECLRVIGITGISEGRFSPYPVFKLLWASTSTHEEILRYAIPNIRSILDCYLGYVAAKDIGSAQAIAAKLLPEAHLGTGDELFLLPFVNTLIEHNEIASASLLWDKLFRRGMLPYPGPDPAQGRFVTDGTFEGPPLNLGFDWRLTLPESTQSFSFSHDHSYVFDFDGHGPESFGLLTQILPLMPSRDYTFAVAMKCDFDPTRSGLRWTIVNRQSGKVMLLAVSANHPFSVIDPHQIISGTFTAPSSAAAADLRLDYTRQLGTVHIQGHCELFSVSLRLLPTKDQTHRDHVLDSSPG